VAAAADRVPVAEVPVVKITTMQSAKRVRVQVGLVGTEAVSPILTRIQKHIFIKDVFSLKHNEV
jgi:hypothetical protein